MKFSNIFYLEKHKISTNFVKIQSKKVGFSSLKSHTSSLPKINYQEKRKFKKRLYKNTEKLRNSDYVKLKK